MVRQAVYAAFHTVLLNSGFVSMILPEYVTLYGQQDFERSMQALKFFTVFGSSEFAVRHFLRLDFRSATSPPGCTTWASMSWMS